MGWFSSNETMDYKIGDLITPKNVNTLPTLAFKPTAFLAPKTIDLRDYCAKTQDQGALPWCAAYSACGFATNVLWRKTDFPTTIDAEPIYRFAKSIDDSPNTEGTTLHAALQGLLKEKYFDETICSVATLRTMPQVKYAIHKFGCCLLGMIVSREWYKCSAKKATISGKKDRDLLGGHAVLACGYNEDGMIIQNSWGVEWGSYGFALITWAEFLREFMYGAVLDNCLYDTKMN